MTDLKKLAETPRTYEVSSRWHRDSDAGWMGRCQEFEELAGTLERECTTLLQEVETLRARNTVLAGEVIGYVRIPKEPTDDWAEAFCAAVNWHPNGTSNTFVEGRIHTVTFRDLAKGYIRAAITTALGEKKP